MSALSHSLYRQSIVDDLIDIIKGNSNATEKDVREELWQRIRTNEDYYRLMFDNWFNANYGRLIIHRGNDTIAVFRRKERDFSKRRLANKRLKMLVTEQLFRIVLTMTFKECVQAGGRFAAIGKLGKPNEIVGKKLTEQQVRNVWFRNA